MPNRKHCLSHFVLLKWINWSPWVFGVPSLKRNMDMSCSLQSICSIVLFLFPQSFSGFFLCGLATDWLLSVPCRRCWPMRNHSQNHVYVNCSTALRCFRDWQGTTLIGMFSWPDVSSLFAFLGTSAVCFHVVPFINFHRNVYQFVWIKALFCFIRSLLGGPRS